MILATLETRHYSFTALGRDTAHARRVMEATWTQHCRDTGAEMTWAELEDDVNYLEISPGEGYRDDRRVVTGV